MKKIAKLAGIFLLSISAMSCDKTIGYSVVLWNSPDQNLADGTVVPVYLKSNISKVYVASYGDSKEKFELPLWQLSEPESKKKALKKSAEYEDYQGTYAKCVLDGLPIRSGSLNTSKQVYRLRKNEIVRVLYKGEGVAPTNGKQFLEGDWLRVLTSDGTLGWCFSYNLRLFKMNADGTYGDGATEAEVQEKDELLEQILATKWYPDYYSQMISKKRIDLDYFKPEYGFDTGYASGTISIKLPNLNVSFPNSGTEKTDEREYKFNDAPVQIYARNAKSLSLKYTDERGMPKSYNFISLNLGEDETIDSVISEEKERRQKLYKSIQQLGPDFSSGNYGDLSFNENNEFSWHGYSKLVPSVLPRGIKGNGTVDLKYFLPQNLAQAWDGVLTFDFENNPEVNFLYKKESNGLRLAFANVYRRFDENTGRDDITVSLPVNSIILFFQNKK